MNCYEQILVLLMHMVPHHMQRLECHQCTCTHTMDPPIKNTTQLPSNCQKAANRQATNRRAATVRELPNYKSKGRKPCTNQSNTRPHLTTTHTSYTPTIHTILYNTPFPHSLSINAHILHTYDTYSPSSYTIPSPQRSQLPIYCSLSIDARIEEEC